MKESKYQLLFEELKGDILSGHYRHGQKMPSEAALIQKTGVSRITVSRAFRELQNAGLVKRVAGSGSFAQGPGVTADRAFLFGLLIPELGETEVFSHICRAIANARQAKSHALLWGNPGSPPAWRQAVTLADQFIQRGVDGVFFAPLEYGADAEKINRRVLHKLRRNNIAVVLLDRRIAGLSNRDRADIASLNHRQAGYTAAQHLLESGCTKLSLISAGSHASSVSDRRAGAEQAMAEYGIGNMAEFDVEQSPRELRRWLRSDAVAGVVCINDRIAGRVLQLANVWRIDVPQKLRVTGIDDIGYASMLAVPLTTVRQPIEQIGESALHLMLDRIQSPNSPNREVLLDGALIVRASTGTASVASTNTRRHK